jgi:hypothetical protein
VLIDLDRVVVAAREHEPVPDALRRILGAEVVGRDQLPFWSAKRTTLRAGVSEIEVLEPDGVGAVADFVGRRGPGLFAVGFAAATLKEFRLHLEAQGVFYEKHDRQLFLSADKGVDLPGLNVVISPAEEREPAGLLQRLCGATLLTRHPEAGPALARILGADSSRLSKLSQTPLGLTATLLRVGDGLAHCLAILAPWDASTSIGRLFLRYRPHLYMASAHSEQLAAIRERLGPDAYQPASRSTDTAVLIPARLLRGLRLGVFADASAGCASPFAASLLADSDPL